MGIFTVVVVIPVLAIVFIVRAIRKKKRNLE
jgi:hypothetical protein